MAGLLLMDDSTTLEMTDFMAAGFNQLPLVLFFIGLAALALGYLPRYGQFIYLYLTYSFFVVYFDGLVLFPEWFIKTSVQGWLPQLPAEAFNAKVFVAMTMLSFLMIILGAIGYNKRDLIEEG